MLKLQRICNSYLSFALSESSCNGSQPDQAHTSLFTANKSLRYIRMKYWRWASLFRILGWSIQDSFGNSFQLSATWYRNWNNKPLGMKILCTVLIHSQNWTFTHNQIRWFSKALKLFSFHCSSSQSPDWKCVKTIASKSN